MVDIFWRANLKATYLQFSGINCTTGGKFAGESKIQ